MIRRLTYVSRLRPGLSPGEIPRIVSGCRARNELEGISGVLLFTGADFAHLIEGPPEPVANLWARIRADDRHCDIVTLFDENAPSRWFADWRVGYPTDSAAASRKYAPMSSAIPNSHIGCLTSSMIKPGRKDKDSGALAATLCWKTDATA
jgi:hypothetical protein